MDSGEALPIVQVSIGGIAIAGLLHATLTSTNCFSTDTFSLAFALGALPLTNAVFWAELDPANAQVDAAVSGSFGLLAVISGVVDNLSFDPIRGLVVLEGRDLMARLIDTYRQQDFVNQTASEVVTTIAQQHGLDPVVTPTAEIVGRYYGDGYTRLSLGQFSRFRSDWDVVVELARENRFDAYVKGRSLYFQPAGELLSLPINVDLTDVSLIRFERNLSLGSSPSSCVQSWNSQDMKSYLNQDQVLAGSSGEQTFLFTGANLTPTQVDWNADRLSAELGRFSKSVNFEMPWTKFLEPRDTLLLTGTASPFDGLYQVDRVEREYSFKTGSRQSVRAISLY